MAAYHKVEVSLNTNAVEVGIPSPQTVNVVLPLVGPQGPQGETGPAGPPGEVSGTIVWDNVTDKPSTFPPSTHQHVSADITDFTAAVEAVSPPADWDTLANKPNEFPPSAHAESHYPSGSDPLNTVQFQSVLGNDNLGEDINYLDGIVSGLATVANTGDYDDLTNKPSSFTPSAHASSHHTGGTDAIAAGSIGAATSGPITSSGLTGTGGGRLIGRIAAGSGALEEIAVSSPLTVSSGSLGLLSGVIPSASSATPQALGTAAAGISNDFARADHVHAMPSAADVGAAESTHTHLSADITDAASDDTPNTLVLRDNNGASNFTNIKLTQIQTEPTAGSSFYEPLIVDDEGTVSAVGSKGADVRSALGLGTAATADIGTGAGDVCAGDDARLSDARTPTSHTHGNITNDGKVGTTAGLPLKTGTAGVVEAGAFGTSAGTFCEGNDARLSDARTPLSHTHTAADIDSGAAAANTVLTADGSGGASFQPASGGGSSIMQAIAVGFVLN